MHKGFLKEVLVLAGSQNLIFLQYLPLRHFPKILLLVHVASMMKCEKRIGFGVRVFNDVDSNSIYECVVSNFML